MQRAGDSLTLMGFFGRDDKQLEQLRALYGERNDRELLAMYEQREGLTETAQQALEQVMRERHLSATDTVATGAEDELGGVDEAELLYIFDDAFQAREAIRHLTEAEVTHRVVDWYALHPELLEARSMLQLALLVPKDEQAHAVAVLRETLDLFPLDEEGVELNAMGELALVAMFDLANGLLAAQALGEAGISYFWRDGREETKDLPDAETVAIEVRASQLQRAVKLVEEKLAMVPPEAD